MIVEIRMYYASGGGFQVEYDYWNDQHDTDVINHSLYQDGEEWQIIAPASGPVAINTEKFGEYITIDGSGIEYFASPFCGSSPDGSKNRRRSSLELTYEQQRILEQIALNVGATWKEKGSWRVMLRKLYAGELRLTRRRSKNIIPSQIS